MILNKMYWKYGLKKDNTKLIRIVSDKKRNAI